MAETVQYLDVTEVMGVVMVETDSTLKVISCQRRFRAPLPLLEVSRR